MAKPATPQEQPDPLSAAVALAEAKQSAKAARDAATAVHLLWPRSHPRYLVTVWLRDDQDHFTAVGFDVTSTSDMAVGTTIMRDLPVASLVREAIRAHLAPQLAEAEKNISGEVQTRMGEFPGVPPDEEFLRLRTAFWERRKAEITEKLKQASGEGKGRRYPEGFLEDVAAIVRDARSNGEPTGKKVAEMLNIEVSAATNLISRARARGLID